jgi:hypothetical protein
MALTTKMLANAGSGVVTSDQAGQYNALPSHQNFTLGILRCQRVRDRTGLVQVAASAGLTATVTVQGRPTPVAPWLDILNITQADWGAALTFGKVITLMPEMRARSNVTAGATPAVSAWITE